MPSIRHTGANTRRAWADAASSPTISASPSITRSCPAKHAASEGTIGNNQANPRGNFAVEPRGNFAVEPRGNSLVGEATAAPRSPVRRTTGSFPARNRASNTVIRCSARRTRIQTNLIITACIAHPAIPGAIRAATARHNPSRVCETRSARVKVAV